MCNRIKDSDGSSFILTVYNSIYPSPQVPVIRDITQQPYITPVPESILSFYEFPTHLTFWRDEISGPKKAGKDFTDSVPENSP